jgi:hypothetical protein
MNYNFNYQCIKTAENFGNTVYHNICSGQNYTIPWGSVDWITNLAGIGIAAAVITLVSGLAVMLTCLFYKIVTEV